MVSDKQGDSSKICLPAEEVIFRKLRKVRKEGETERSQQCGRRGGVGQDDGS